MEPSVKFTEGVAMVGARARDVYDKAAKERQSDGQKSGGRGHTRNSVETFPPSLESGKSRDQAGKAVSVSGKLTDRAKSGEVATVGVATDVTGCVSPLSCGLLVPAPSVRQRRRGAHPAPMWMWADRPRLHRRQAVRVRRP